MAICESTEGMRGVSLGVVTPPHTDNWIGRLQAEYAKSEASAKQGFQLAEWFIKKIKPLIIIRGNHDAWSGQGDPLEYIHQAGSMYEQWKALVELQWPVLYTLFHVKGTGSCPAESTAWLPALPQRDRRTTIGCRRSRDV